MNLRAFLARFRRVHRRPTPPPAVAPPERVCESCHYPDATTRLDPDYGRLVCGSCWESLAVPAGGRNRVMRTNV